MTNDERINEMIRQYRTTKSQKKRNDLYKGIKNAERKRRRDKKQKEGTIFI
jgi:hypothetical protein